MTIPTEKIEEFAEILVDHSAEIEEGDNVYLLVKSLEALPLFEEVRRQVIKKGAFPHEHVLYDSQVGSSALDYDWIKYASEKQLEQVSEAKMKEIKEMDAYIRIGGEKNTKELADLDPGKISKWGKTTEKLLEERLKTKWVATRYPTSSMAQEAGMSTERFEQFVVDAVTGIDWEELEKKNAEIKNVFDGAEEVRIVGEETDLTLSLENREAIPDNGHHNVPSGEVFYAPVKDTLEGKIKFSYPGIEGGNEVSGIELFFENGRIIEYSAEKNEDFLEKMIETDEGSHFIGELGIGTNRQITEYIKNTLFDEKIGGTVHLAIGRAYEKCVPEGEEANQSGVHWDLVKDLRPRAGGGKIFVDGNLVQKDGEWVF